MSVTLEAFCVDAADPAALAGFWSELFGWPVVDDPCGMALDPTDDTGLRIRFLRSGAPRSLPNLFHYDLTSATPEDQDATVVRAIELGASHLDVGQGSDAEHVVLADPEGNEFCVLPAGNRFLADCGFLGALSGDGTHEVGVFWSEALGWPLVWDEGEETAVRSPHGGPKVTWGGRPLNPRPPRNRVHLDLRIVDGGELEAEVERLMDLGAERVEERSSTSRVVLTDPDGSEFCVRA
ncbi:VOC family protein [Phycicoccus sp. CSK15P-2]|uniref:VOC family protein n=1 Tax=Phycicoccus sp. CSK15P-2 TaxID=2807627 RepID=UPI00194DDC4F|nr:VOC family protein [Phycicoccus sp. CSK15P-2]MBM6405205.1 VOC family protein [Phycicoccus sp. CSK15P-2]